MKIEAKSFRGTSDLQRSFDGRAAQLPQSRPIARVSTAVRAHAGEDGFDDGACARVALDGGQPPKLPGDPQRDAIDRAVATGQPQQFVDSDGKTVTVQIQAEHHLFGGDTRVVTVGDDHFTVKFDTGAGVDKNALLTRLVDSYSETPAQYRGALQRVVITSASSLTSSGAPVAARAANGTITFYDNGSSVNGWYFDHEMGHLIGRQEENKDDGPWSDLFGEPPPVPNGWDAAAASDGNFVSPYAKEDHDDHQHYTEDFGDAWAFYMEAVDAGPAAVEAFKQQYPARYEILENMYTP